MNDLLKLAAIVIVAVIVLALVIRLIIGFVTGLLIPLILLAAVLGGAYWLFMRSDDTTEEDRYG